MDRDVHVLSCQWAFSRMNIMQPSDSATQSLSLSGILPPGGHKQHQLVDGAI